MASPGLENRHLVCRERHRLCLLMDRRNEQRENKLSPMGVRRRGRAWEKRGWKESEGSEELDPGGEGGCCATFRKSFKARNGNVLLATAIIQGGWKEGEEEGVASEMRKCGVPFQGNQRRAFIDTYRRAPYTHTHRSFRGFRHPLAVSYLGTRTSTTDPLPQPPGSPPGSWAARANQIIHAEALCSGDEVVQ